MNSVAKVTSNCECCYTKPVKNLSNSNIKNLKFNLKYYTTCMTSIQMND